MPRQIPCMLVFVLAVSGVAAHRDIPPDEVDRMIREGENPIILDVREYSEFCAELQHIDNAVNLPWITEVLQARFSELPTDRKIVAICASGGRSHLAASFLDSMGFDQVFDMIGGMSAWTLGTESCSTESTLVLSKAAGSVAIDWTPMDGTQDYDLIRGYVDLVTLIETLVDLGPAECLANDSPFTFHQDAEFTLPDLYFYLSRQKGGDWGQSSGQQARIPAPAACE